MKKNNLFIVIVGCGRLGYQLADNLSRHNHSVVIVDREESAFNKLSDDFSGFRIEGDASQISVLKQANMHKADVVIAATHEDNRNL